MQRLYGSDDLFPDDVIDAYYAYQSVNHVTSHDGFTLYDLVSYEHKRNAANGHDNRDGSDANWSSNHGWEGDAGAAAHVLALRERQANERPRGWMIDMCLAGHANELRWGWPQKVLLRSGIRNWWKLPPARSAPCSSGARTVESSWHALRLTLTKTPCGSLYSTHIVTIAPRSRRRMPASVMR